MSLAVFFGWHVIYPNATAAASFSGGVAWVYAIIAALAFIALWKFKLDIIKVITACALAGLAYTYLG